MASYTTVDACILNNQNLGHSVISHLDKEVVWGAVLHLKSKAMKPQGEDRQMKFRDTMYTDGVGVSVLKQNHETTKKSSGGGVRKDRRRCCLHRKSVARNTLRKALQ